MWGDSVNGLIIYNIILTVLCLVLCVTGIARHIILFRRQKKFFENMAAAFKRGADDEDEEE